MVLHKFALKSLSSSIGGLTRMPQEVHVIVCTHTERHLRLVLEGIQAQSTAPDTISLVTDGRIDGVSAVAHEFSQKVQSPFFYTTREHQGVMRLAQTRNNAVRTLVNHEIRTGRLVFIDGDILLHKDAIQTHSDLGNAGELLIADRISLTKEQTDQQLLIDSTATTNIEGMDLSGEIERLEKRRRKARKHLWMRKLGIAKKANPKIIGAQISVDFQDFLRVNGFDEEYEGYGCEDDDLAARLYRSGVKPTVAVNELVAYHLWHPTQAKKKWHDNIGARRFTSVKTPVRAQFGFDNPMQPNVTDSLKTDRKRVRNVLSLSMPSLPENLGIACAVNL